MAAPRPRRPRSGFTLMESLMATGMLLAIIVAVTSAITAGQQQSYEAHRRIAGALAAEELMGRLATETYARLPTWHGYTENAGELRDMAGNPLPSTLQMVSRTVTVILEMKTLAGLDVRVRGMTVNVRTYASDGRTMSSLTRFVPEPQP